MRDQTQLFGQESILRPRGSFVKLLGLGRGCGRRNWGVYISGGIGCLNDTETRVVTNAGIQTLYGKYVIGKLKTDPDFSEFPMRWTLPFVLYRTTDGVEFLADRDNRVLCSRIDGRVTVGDEDETGRRVRKGEDQGQRIFESDSPPWADESALARCRAVLAEWGVRPRPWTGIDGLSGVECIG
jgi:hypothetical protein